VDAGSGGCRAVVVDLHGRLVSSAARGWAYEVPADAQPMGKEFAPGEFWDTICEVTREAVREASDRSGDIVAVSTTSQREGTVFLDQDGQELYGGPNLDLRALVEGFEIDGECGSDVYQITGHAPSLLFAPAKLRWFQRNRPEVYERIAAVLSIGDWITYRLSGQIVGEASCVSDLGLVDVHQRCLSQRLFEMLELPDCFCPTLATSGALVGEVRPEAAEAVGLSPGTLVAVGGADTQCGLLGMGVKEEGEVGIVAGWSGSVQMVTTEPTIDQKGRIWTTCHALPGKWVLESNAQECGGAYRWVRELLFGSIDRDDEAYAEMDRLAGSVVPGAGGATAFIGPQAMDMSRMKVSLGGFIFPISPSVTGIEPGHLVRATMENICFAMRANCAQLEEISGVKAASIGLGGGLGKSDVLVQMLADILGKPVTCFEEPYATAAGTAMCAAVGAGDYADLAQAMVAMRPKHRSVEPEPETAGQYDALYEKWVGRARWLDDLLDHVG
jgi:sugar (pentulose or hexulose) kinase